MIYAGLPFSLEAFFNAFCLSLSGFAAAFLILLATALASKNGTGIGGGDIKLAALLGWVYGAIRIIPVLLLSAGLASIVSLIIRRKARDSPLSLPFVPFLAVGCLTVTITTIFQF